MRPSHTLASLPPATDRIETLPLYKAHSRALGALSGLSGLAKGMPNQEILIDALALQEAKASSAIEGIHVSQDALYRAQAFPEDHHHPEATEVSLCRDALLLGFQRLGTSSEQIANSALIDMFRLLKGQGGGFRITSGTVLRNQATGKVIYVPPQDASEIDTLMADLERFVNDDSLSPLEPLIKMALIHHQFESIHPFTDGNGRIGRILSLLYLVRTGLLDTPILCLSRFINATKPDYYRLLQAVRESGDWESWVIYMLTGIAVSSEATLRLVESIRVQMASTKHRMRSALPKIYSRDLLNSLFRHPYTRIEFVQRELGLKARQTAARYLDQLADHGFVDKRRHGRHSCYVNTPLLDLLLDFSGDPDGP